MSVPWTLEYAGQERTLAAWGIRQPRLTFRSLDVDQFAFYIPRGDVLEAPAFAYNSEVVLRRAGVRHFIGRVQPPAAAGSGQTEGDHYTVNGPWWLLQRLVYQQRRCVAGVQQMTPRVTLGQNQFGQRISVGRQIAEVVQYALTTGLPIVTGALPEFDEAWLEEAADLTCAGAILKLLRFMPQVAGWFDYSSGVPVLHVQPRDLLSAVTLDATAGDTLVEFRDLRQRSDLVPAGVTLIFEGQERSDESAAGDGRTRTTLTRQEAGATSGLGAIVATVPLQRGETVPPTLALAYWAELQTAPWEGNLRLLEEECSGSLRPGKVVNISNGRAAWASMRAVVQTVHEDLATGETTAELGAAEHLSPQDFIAQQQLARRRFTRTTFPLVQPCRIADPNGDQGDPEDGIEPDLIDNPDAGIDPDSLAAERADQNLPRTAEYLASAWGENEGYFDLQVCNDGVESCVRVRGAPCPS